MNEPLPVFLVAKELISFICRVMSPVECTATRAFSPLRLTCMQSFVLEAFLCPSNTTTHVPYLLTCCMYTEQSLSQLILMDHGMGCISAPPSRTYWTWFCEPITLSSYGDHKAFARVALFAGIMTYLNSKSDGGYVQGSYINTLDRPQQLTPAVTKR